MTETHLITLDEATRRYPVTKRTLRRHIAAGALPASKPGRALLISAEDLARLIAPILRQPPPRTERETPSQRERRQLREAGIAT